MVGRFVPPLESFAGLPFTGMWGVAIREDGIIFANAVPGNRPPGS